MVFQHFNLFKNMTVLENVTYAPKVVNHKKQKKEAEEDGMNLLGMVGLADKAHEYPNSCPAGSSSRWPSPGPWPCIPMYCCWMNPRPPWIRKW